jgi:hypothetical protein
MGIGGWLQEGGTKVYTLLKVMIWTISAWFLVGSGEWLLRYKAEGRMKV